MDVTKLKYNSEGLIPVIVQEAGTGEVLMMAYMNRDSLQITLDEGRTCFYSRSRQTLWRKGETSGNTQKVVSIEGDCDNDCLLARVVTEGGPACHTGSRSCFGAGDAGSAEFQVPDASIVFPTADEGILSELYEVVKGRKGNPKEGSYTTYLFTKGQDKILKKVGEETSEVIIASKNHSVDEIVYEMADLWYHCLVLLADHGIDPKLVFEELKSRRK